MFGCVRPVQNLLLAVFGPTVQTRFPGFKTKCGGGCKHKKGGRESRGPRGPCGLLDNQGILAEVLSELTGPVCPRGGGSHEVRVGPAFFHDHRGSPVVVPSELTGPVGPVFSTTVGMSQWPSCQS